MFQLIYTIYTSEEAFAESEKIRKRVAGDEKLQKYADYFPITISIGVSSYLNHW